MPDEIVPQRCVVVLPSTGEFDSRTYRIARTLHERGHEVTVLARWKPGLAVRELHPVGYPIVRVAATAVDGLPFRALTLPILRLLRLAAVPILGPVPRGAGSALSGAGPGAASVAQPGADAGGAPTDTRSAPTDLTDAGSARTDAGSDRTDAAASTDAGSDPTDAADAGSDEAHPGWAHPAERDPGRVRGYVRRARIFLMIRSHRQRALAITPAADLYHGMAYMGIPVALGLGKRHAAKVVYDSRDIYMVAANLARLRGPIKAVLARLERGWARSCDRVITVNEPYATELARRFDVPPPLVVMNCSYRYSPPATRPRRFHHRFNLDPATRVVLYQGGFSRGRGVEQLIRAIHLVPNAVLVVMGYGALEAEFRAAADAPANRGRIHVLAAVPPTELLDWVASADVVGVLFQHDTLNNYLSTPNKFLEAMAAGVPSVCSDHPGMGPIARQSGCGIAVDPADISAIAAAIRSIVDAPVDEREAAHARALAAAHETYNWESQVSGLLDEYTRLTGRRW